MDRGWLLLAGAGLLIALPSAAAEMAVVGRPYTNGLGMELVWGPTGCWVGKHEVTQEQYAAVMLTNPSRWPGARRPVENVDWHEATRFCEQLTAREATAGLLPAGWRYGLPTEKEWESIVGDARLQDMVYGRWEGLAPLGTMPVGSRGPNCYGLYDVRGNVWEWCSDWWDHKHNERVVRGGAWDLVHPADLEASYRPVSAAVGRGGNIGFRVVLRRD
jgi:formylglycine-generating enzyme required for sulfatase activity